MSKKKRISLVSLCIIAVLIMVISVSYAYFTSVISGESNPNVITSGTMRLEFSDGPAVSLSDALPGDSVTKTFNVKNTGTLTTTYDVYFSEICNMFVDKTDLVYTIRHTSANGYELLTETEVPSTSSKIIDSQSIAPNETQTYEITIKFLSKDENQDDNQGAHFSSKLNINNSKEPISCPVKVGNTLCSFNCDTDNDGTADTNLDNNNDGICDFNCDNNNDKTCDTNCDTTGNGVCNYNCYNRNGSRCTLNCDIDKDGTPDTNVDTTGDGQADTNIDDNGDGRCDRNCSSGGIGGGSSSSNTLYRKILAQESASITAHGNTAPDFTMTSETDEGMYKETDDLGDVYYYRGAVEDNYVSFAGFCWRIVRTNGDHSVRLIYQGITCDAMGDNATIGKYEYNILNGDDDNAYVGYMYGTAGSSTYEETHANINSSNAKIQLESWYATSLGMYDRYIADQIFCNDRQAYMYNSNNELVLGGGYEYLYTIYAPDVRYSITYQPVLTCTQKNDRFTKNDTINGNGKLSQKVGMLTADEVVMAGVSNEYPNSNYSYYLYTGTEWLLGSPERMYAIGSSSMHCVNDFGNIASGSTSLPSGLRPVISLLSSVEVSSGNGTQTNPWVIKTNIPDKCSNVTYRDGTTCSVTYRQQTGTYNRLAYSSIDSNYRCPAKDIATGGGECTGNINACASTTCSLLNCSNYNSCPAVYTNETGTQTRTCTQTCVSALDSSITCSTNANYQDTISCTGTQLRPATNMTWNYSSSYSNSNNKCKDFCFDECGLNGYEDWSCTSSDSDEPIGLNQTTGESCWCAK